MSHLLDTNVLSELRKPRGELRVREWVDAQPLNGLFISAITVLEIETGILRVARKDESQASALRHWFEGRVLTGFEGRILPVDLGVVRHVARLHVPDRAPQHDALIAGTALAHDLTVVTRNTRDFANTGVELLNPWIARD
ncbi:type II toxin-antitoxin system VapC family toxin [Corynebacterium sp. AOP40-9SA-29]|uniref:type II toxin-antitoxin system VapC family toxin n=1 Tax=Corynebacterium sp. AOP40-9SA-29 TaxID=3457677 RepID=UPI004033ACFB